MERERNGTESGGVVNLIVEELEDVLHRRRLGQLKAKSVDLILHERKRKNDEQDERIERERMKRKEK
jgi:hypothetical protein